MMLEEHSGLDSGLRSEQSQVRFPGMFGTCLGHVWGMFGTCLGHVRDMLGACSGHASGMFGQVWDKFGASLGHDMESQRNLYESSTEIRRKYHGNSTKIQHRCVTTGFHIMPHKTSETPVGVEKVRVYI